MPNNNQQLTPDQVMASLGLATRISEQLLKSQNPMQTEGEPVQPEETLDLETEPEEMPMEEMPEEEKPEDMDKKMEKMMEEKMKPMMDEHMKKMEERMDKMMVEMMSKMNEKPKE